MDNYFDMRQGKAESIPDYIFREGILTVALQKDTAIDLDEKIRGCWLMRTSNLTEREISGIKIITLREAGDRARDRPGGYAEAPNFHLHGNSADDQADTISESESNCSEQWCELDGQEEEALISLKRCTKETSTCDKIEKILPQRWRPCKEHREIHRRVDESDVVQSMWCHRSLGRRLLTACQKPQEEIPLCNGHRKKSSVQKREI